MLKITATNIRVAFSELEQETDFGGGNRYSFDLHDSGQHYPKLYMKRFSKDTWLVGLQVDAVIGGEPFSTSNIELCFLSHGVETAIQAIESLGIELA